MLMPELDWPLVVVVMFVGRKRRKTATAAPTIITTTRIATRTAEIPLRADISGPKPLGRYLRSAK